MAVRAAVDVEDEWVADAFLFVERPYQESLELETVTGGMSRRMLNLG